MIRDGSTPRLVRWDDEACAGLSVTVKDFAWRWALNMQNAMNSGALLADIAQRAWDDAGGERLSVDDEQRAFLALQKGWKYGYLLLEWRKAAVAPGKSRKK